MPPNLLKGLPSVSDLLESPTLKRLVNRVNHNVVVSRVRTLLDDLKREVQTAAHEMPLPSVSELAERIVRRLQQDERPRLRPVVNATGVLFPSELGPPPLAESAVEEVVVAARDYASVELDLLSGKRVAPSVAVQELLCEICQCEAALVVHNHSAALWLSLAALSAGREVVTSRGEVAAIDGIALPQLAAAAGAILREVGSTHQTTAADYSEVAGATTGLVLRLQPTDFAVVGAAASHASVEELARVARKIERPFVHDLGYGGLVTLESLLPAGISAASASLAAGADVVVISGDKLLGGPRCGILVGRRKWIEPLAAHPLLAALAADKLSLAALAGTVRLYRQPDIARRDIPLLRLLETPLANLRGRAERLAPQLSACAAVRDVEVCEGVTPLGPAAVPAWELPTVRLSLAPESGTAERFAASLRNGTPAVVGRVQGDRYELDLRTVIPRHDMLLVEAIAALKPAVEAPTSDP